MEIGILDFVEDCRHLAKQALGKHVHVVIHCFRREKRHSFRETQNQLEYLTALLELLDLEEGDVPDFTTLNKSFDRFKLWVWQALLRVSAQRHPQSVYVALNSTFFGRGHASADSRS